MPADRSAPGSDAWKYWDERRAGNITRRGMARHPGRHRALGRHLHDHGHRLDDDGDHRRHGPDAARRLLDPGRRRRPPAHGRRLRPAHRRDGVGGPDAREDRHRRRRAQRRDRGDGDRLLDQRRRPPDRDGAPRRRRPDARRPRRARPRDAADRQRPALRQGLPDGGLLLRGRPARADEANRGAARHLGADRHRQDARREPRRAPRSTTTTSSARCRTRSTTRARWRCCAATSRPPARSSSPPPATRNTDSTRGRRWSSTAIPR